MRKNVAILQSNYIPWKGYFDIIRRVDLFVFHDDLRYTKQDWRNRNRIKTPGGTKWLTIPCGSDQRRRICDVAPRDPDWQLHHWRSIVASYTKAPYFDHYKDFFEDFYTRRPWGNLSELNRHLIEHVCREWLQTTTPFDDSRNYGLTETRGARVLELLEKVGATDYLSGPRGKGYLEEAEFVKRGISLSWMDYSEYPEYEQLYPPFEHNVSIIDLLFSVGPDVKRFMLGAL